MTDRTADVTGGDVEFPVKTYTSSVALDDTQPPVQLFLQAYSNRLFLILSQYDGRIGSLLQVTLDNPAAQTKMSTVTWLMGNAGHDHAGDPGGRGDVYEILGSEIRARLVDVQPTDDRPLLLGLTLKEGWMASSEDFKRRIQTIVAEVEEAYRETNIPSAPTTAMRDMAI
ncbi:hypothetical protein BZG36_02503 [Bifiguratus adelaidae]|uniref:Proteasome assembly chaperone 3 n=1 Tax=Bifiguratus adelaidae TaxID=1938954 RepID=A0A261Y341_9FUNG|nr:hypothetical protein BZG36_02503 [Bifiguratus adelaidae]